MGRTAGAGAAAALVAMAVLVGACSSSGGSTGAASDAPPCPTDAATVVVTVDQWGDIVRSARRGLHRRHHDHHRAVDVDPHEFEPSPADNARFLDADLVVVNGVGYDSWADRVIDTVSPRPPVVDAGDVAGLVDGDNPHVWYGPGCGRAGRRRRHRRARDACSRTRPTTSPTGPPTWEEAMAPYRAEIAAATTVATGRTYAATEPVFDDMAAAVGLVDRTPEGYRSAALNESDPSPADVAAFEEALRGGRGRRARRTTPRPRGPCPTRSATSPSRPACRWSR